MWNFIMAAISIKQQMQEANGSWAVNNLSRFAIGLDCEIE
jgi:hypothetical protein